MKVRLSSPTGTVHMDLVDPRDHISRVIIKNRNWYEFDLLSDLQRRAAIGTAIDVGAHIGNHSLFMAALGFNVVSLEPNPASFSQLAHNVKVNARLSLDLHEVAAGRDFNTGTVFSPNPTNSGMAYVEPSEPNEVPDNSYVQIIPLDSLEVDNVTVIKIDVEGHEIDVLTGAAGLLKKFHPVLYVEASSDEARLRVEKFLKPYGYKERGRFGKTDTWCFTVDAKARDFSVTIMAHPARTDMANALSRQVDDQGIENFVVWDERNNRWDTGRRSLLLYDPAVTHHLVLQDDAVIPDNFVKLVGTAISVPPPDSPVCLYTGKAINRRLKNIHGRISWVTMPGVNWGVGIVVPSHHVKELVAFGDKRTEGNYDLRISRFYQKKGLTCWYPQPSLVNHRHTPSLVEGRGSRRVASSYVGKAGRGFDPNGPIVNIRWSR